MSVKPPTAAIDLQERLRAADADRDKVVSNYRALLVECERKSQDDFDKGVMTLSGGALGVSFAFVNTFSGESTRTRAMEPGNGLDLLGG